MYIQLELKKNMIGNQSTHSFKIFVQYKKNCIKNKMSNDNQSHIYIMYPLAVNESKPMRIINFNKRHTAFSRLNIIFIHH